MGFFDALKAVFIPALIAAALYLLLAYALLPLYRAHRARYSEYLPLHTLSTSTSTLRSGISSRLSSFLLPRSMRWRRQTAVVDARRGSGDSGLSGEGLQFGEEEGESMVGFGDVRVERGRDERGGRVEVGRGHVVDSQRRLSRELEEGFRDESENEGDERRR